MDEDIEPQTGGSARAARAPDEGSAGVPAVGASATALHGLMDAIMAEADDDLKEAIRAGGLGHLSPEHEYRLATLLIERSDAWLQANGEPITNDDYLDVTRRIQPLVSRPSGNTSQTDHTTGTDDDVHRLYRALWTEGQVLQGSDRRFYRIRSALPPWLQAYHHLTDAAGAPSSPSSPAMAARPRLPTIVPAFLHAGRDGVGRISSSQVNLAIYTACVAPKSEWEETSKGFPRYTFRVPSGDIAITLSPDVAVRKDLPQQVATMYQLRDELSVEDWDVMTALMAQVLAEGRPDASAFVTADAVLDNRKVERKKSGGYSSGHHPKMRTKIAESINRLAHLRVRTETLQIRELAPDGTVRWVPADWNERVLQIQGDWTRGDTGAVLGWRYNFGASFTTFLARPNRYVGYLLQETLALHVSKQQTAKQLAHYLALHLRIDARNGRGLDRRLGELLDGAKIAADPQRQQRTIDRLEGALRDLIKAGLIRIEWNGRVWTCPHDR